MTTSPPRFAAFVSPHGFGHAARASAVIAVAHARFGAEFDVFTTAPRWFFEESLDGFFDHHELVCDVGFRQRSALHVDLDATAAALGAMLPFDEARIDRLAKRLIDRGCVGVLCDISPMGVAVAERAGLPSVLVENFSWGWLYERMPGAPAGLSAYGEALDAWSSRATVHLQTEPLCRKDIDADALIGPISRRPRRGRVETRRRFGLPDEGPVVVVTMGGYPEDLSFLPRLKSLPEVTFLVTGAQESRSEGNLRLLGNTMPIFMPDLMRAADAVVAKLGYGTIAEVWTEGLPFAFVTRPSFPEMPPLKAFVGRELLGFGMDPAELSDGAWIERMPELLAHPRRPREGGGAEAVAMALGKLL
jgi:hypothetical protein